MEERCECGKGLSGYLAGGLRTDLRNAEARVGAQLEEIKHLSQIVDDQRARLEAQGLREWHDARGLDCVAHSEGQECCVDIFLT